MHPMLKLALDLGPLAVFLVAYRAAGLLTATALLIGMTLISLGISYAMEKKLSPMPLITAIAVTFFGGLTLWLNDEHFIKMKPTFVNLTFASILLAGAVIRKPMLKFVLGSALMLDEAGWSKLSLRWGFFFLFLAGVNEVVWRHFSTDFWVNFKVFGMLSLTILFTLCQLPLMSRHMLPEEEKAPPANQDS